MTSDEEMFRNVAADSMAQGFIIEILLAHYLGEMPPDDRLAIVESLTKTGKRTDHFAGLIKDDDRAAEKFADVVVKMHEALDGLIYRAVRRVVAGETAPDRAAKPGL